MIKTLSVKILIQRYKESTFLLLVGIIVLNIGVQIFLNSSRYTIRYDHSYWKIRYLHSQWVAFPVIESIGDDGLYAYQGWRMIHGDDPTTLSAEVPSLGKYLIGLTILIFGNQNIFGIISAIGVITAFFVLNMHLFKNKLLAIIPVAMFSFEPLFLEQMQAPFLDLLYTFFFLMIFFFFFKKRYILSSIFLGLMMSTKSTVSTFAVVVVVLVLYLLLSRNYSSLKRYAISLPISLIVFVLTYLRYFILGHSFREFLGVQKWILTFYSSGAKGSFITPWEIFILGNWHTWWGEFIRVHEWTIMWPLLFFVSLAYIARTALSKARPNEFLLLALWVIVYFIFLFVVPVWPRYLLLILPFMYNLAIWLVVSFAKTRLR